MSNEQDKFNHSKRLQKDKNAIARQLKLAKGSGNDKLLKQPHRLEKQHALDCGHPKCIICGNPRRIFNEKTIQEQRFDQPKIDSVDSEEQN